MFFIDVRKSVEKTFRHCIIPTISFSTHATQDIIGF